MQFPRIRVHYHLISHLHQQIPVKIYCHIIGILVSKIAVLVIKKIFTHIAPHLKN